MLSARTAARPSPRLAAVAGSTSQTHRHGSVASAPPPLSADAPCARGGSSAAGPVSAALALGLLAAAGLAVLDPGCAVAEVAQHGGPSLGDVAESVSLGGCV